MPELTYADDIMLLSNSGHAQTNVVSALIPGEQRQAVLLDGEPLEKAVLRKRPACTTFSHLQFCILVVAWNIVALRIRAAGERMLKAFDNHKILPHSHYTLDVECKGALSTGV